MIVFQFDGIGGTIKRQAARASLTHEYEPTITTARGMYDWAKTLKTDMHFEYSTVAEHEIKIKMLEDRFQNLKAIKGTQSYHAYIPHTNGTILCKKYSNSDIYKCETLL